MSSVADVTRQHEHGGVAHHFENIEQQRDASTLGMWLFLGSEILFFGGVFTAFAVLRSRMPAGFRLGCQQLNDAIGAVNTAVLLTSSLSMALAVWAAHTGQRRMLQGCLGLTILFGTAFIGIKGYEWHHEYTEGLVPGRSFGFTPDGKPNEVLEKHRGEMPDIPDERRPVPMALNNGVEMFFVFYFTITGLHALHMVIGLAVLGVQLALSLASDFGVADFGPVEVAGLYWHFVDVVWIFVFPLLYLLRT